MLVVEYEYVVATIEELEAQVKNFADRVHQLYRQRDGLVALLRSIRKHGGVTERDWRNIDRVLVWHAEEASGKHRTLK